MEKNFLKVDLLPGYKEDKFVSNIIYRIIFVVLVAFVVFYFMFLPYYNARIERDSIEFENNQLMMESAIYNARILERVPNQVDVDYYNTLEFLEENDFSLHLWLNQMLAIDIEGFQLQEVEFIVSKEILHLYGTFDSDQAILELEEYLWSIYWVDSVDIKYGGPGSQGITITYTVGDAIE